MNAADDSSAAFPWKGLWIVVGILFALAALAALLLPQMCSARETARGNTCRNNMRALATALFNYSVRNGHYPGYLNVLPRTDGTPFVDPTLAKSTTPVPVSWAVMILPDIDRQPLYDAYRRLPPPQPVDEVAAKNAAESNRFFTDCYIEQFLCPSDPQPTKTGTPISFVANTGIPDLPSAQVTVIETKGISTLAQPRDWAANGMFFDNFSEHPLIRQDASRRGPMVLMTDDQVRDPRDKTILLTENIDATSYIFRAATHEAEGWRAAEIQTGCIWRAGRFDASRKPPMMIPPAAALQPNVDVGKGTGASYDYCRPSSHHPESVNVAFVGQNVSSLRENISYFVYAKLMASDDEKVHIPARSQTESDAAIHQVFRTHRLSDEDVNP